ncbi:hypothetical protein [Wolbachia endosymbiont (group A) of Agelastica alni]|uniref:hypothetical protein n=1 Tax=Wolbachia endosymbiont (group A) of Agelastica alni TaxID=3066130 RepID=UPI00313312A1
MPLTTLYNATYSTFNTYGGHWDDIIGATCMTPFFFLDPSVSYSDDRRRRLLT